MNSVRFVRQWRWLLILALFAVGVALKLNGSSVGRWQTLLKESGPIRGLVLFTPRDVRADEWRHITPSMLSQARHSPPFPIENESLGAARSPLLMSVPVAYYTTFFRPQLWGFFIFDFEHAFAFYWCCKVFGLFLASGWLLRQIGIKNFWIVAFGTIWIFFSSFVQWWFSTPAMLPEMLASWAMLTGFALMFFARSGRQHLALAAVGFVFFGVNFLLCMYPGFQVPLLYVSVAIVIGIWVQRRSTDEWRATQGLILLSAAVAALVLVLVPFWWSARDTLQMVAQTSYPGVYRNNGGGLAVFDLFSGVLGFFESEQRIPLHYENICEASNFYPLWAVTLPMVALAKWRSRTTVPPTILTLAAVIILLGVYCVVPMPGWLARGSFLGLTTENRLLLGIGMANIILCCLFFDSYPQPILRRSSLSAIAIAAVCLGAGVLWLHPYPDQRLSALIVLINSVIVGLFFWRRARVWFLATFTALLVVNGVAINPVMRGLSPLIGSPAYGRIEQLRVADPDARWIFYENSTLPQLATATGASVLNGSKILPDLNLMRSLDPGGHLAWIYNRFAWIKPVLPDEPGTVTFALFGTNIIELGLPPEHPVLRDENYRYVVFPRSWEHSTEHGFGLVEEIEPSGLFVYKRQTEP